ncbi:MAG TPA: 3-oxoacyl-ACP reductase family protein [Dehalococcoidia bacterium]|nr:3-oxoacyl-ACP reductase family protein [Dehalococcoidia bacterium]
MDLGLAGKVVIVTGGGANIGRAVSLTFAREGARVVVADWDEPQARKLEPEFKALGAESFIRKTDVTQLDDVQAMVRDVNDRFGPVDVLVNNVGWNRDELFINTTPETWDKIIAINYRGTLNCTRAVLDQMIERKSGVIISLGSDAGRMGEYMEAVYGGCKGAVIAFSKAIAREVGRHGIRVNTVCPALTVPESADTIGERSLWSPDMLERLAGDAQQKILRSYPLRKIGKPQDIADMIVFLASDRAGHVTGQTISVNGGYTMM